MNSTPLIAGQRAPGEGLCKKGKDFQDSIEGMLIGLWSCWVQGGLAELPLADLHVQTKIKTVICILRLLTEILFCIYQQLKMQTSFSPETTVNGGNE